MLLKSLIFSVLALTAIVALPSASIAQTDTKAAPTAQSVRALLVANKEGGAAVTQALIAALTANPKLISVVVAASKDASPELLASISAAIAQAIVEIAQTNPEAAAELKKVVEASAPEALKQQVASNLAEATTATAATGAGSGAGILGDVGVPLAPSNSLSTNSPT